MAARHWFEAMVASAGRLATRLGLEAPASEASFWARALLAQAEDLLVDLDFTAPYAGLSEPPGALAGIKALGGIPTLRELGALEGALAGAHTAGRTEAEGSAGRAWLEQARALTTLASRRANDRLWIIESLARQAAGFAALDYDFLYDTGRHLMTVGYNVEQERRDSGHYDLLASEARLSTFVAIARGDAPQESWFALGRLLTSEGGEPILLSWSGSMFEYLMPMLVMPSYENTLLDQTCLAAVNRQIAYGHQRGVPWGLSESGYNAVDAAFNYQYRAFGVPGLGLKRGLGDDLVIAPYASALALMVRPEAACRNLERLKGLGLLGRHGMYEALDYTSSRLPRGQAFAVVKSFMAHHQGMSLLALESLLLHRPMQRRFESDPQFQATTLLLQEKVPASTALHLRPIDFSDARSASTGPEMPIRVLHSSDTPTPEVQLLSNGRYHVMVTNAGGGYSRFKDIAVTRWREDATRDNWGVFGFIRDVATGQFWSTAHQPTLKRADMYEAIFSEARAEFRRRDLDYETHTEIVVSPEDDIELRRTRITNRRRSRRTVEVTSYAEVVLAPPASDALHPAFSNLFVQTEIVHDRQAILCTRRPRSEGERMPWMFHLAAAHGASSEAVSYETDRSRFIGRTRSIESPYALTDAEALSGSEGPVLDPVVAVRLRITLDPGQTVTVDMVTGVSESRETALGLADKYRDRHLADRVIDLAWTHSRVNLQQINATESDAQLYGRLASSILYVNPLLRAEPGVLVRNHRGQSGLWGYAISGDLPIVLLKIGDAANIELVRQLVQAHAYWRLKGLAVDLVIWNEDHAGYRQFLHEQIMGLIAAGLPANLADRPGGIFVRAAEQISNEDRTLFQTVARAIIADSRGTLSDQVGRRPAKETRPALLSRLVPARRPAGEGSAALPSAAPERLFFNGLGGFSRDGREYIITLDAERTTPAPWANVLANDHFGSVISESGASYTWSENAHEFRFTPWGNDPVGDSTGEAIYIRDEETGRFWSPSPSPCRGASPYVTRHGFGYSVFEHEEDGLRSELTVHVDVEAAVKFSALRVVNASGRPRNLSITGYVEWVMGDLKPKTAMHVVTEIDPATGAICARNPYSAEFSDRIAFFDADEATRAPGVTFTADRAEFLGRNGTLGNPAALTRLRLSNRVGAGLDACAAIQIPLDLAPGQERSIIFRLGASGRRGSDDAARRPRGAETCRRSLAAVHDYWARTLGVVQVDCPDPAVNLLANGWLLYQTLACRLWARSGYYQSGGAFGFRDQLQDTMALVYAEPRLTREHLLRSAARQFSEGDAQHWWHPPAGRGVRTRCSDDFLWLPQAICRYVTSTGDHAVLEEAVYFLEGRPVNPDQDSYYDLPLRSTAPDTLYQHGVRAILRALRFGEHGLPLMGTGDWNDGMNLVGMQGRGESVWLGFFLHDTLTRFGALARTRGDVPFADRCRLEAERLRASLDEHGWDGEWYRRAYFDDGTPLGSSENAECRIDSIAQSWSVLSGAADPARQRLAMDALDRHLVRRDRGLVQLLDPPFDTSDLNPGYIKGYVPGVRENGGQYTHAAIWASMAFAAMGDSARAWELFDLINPIRHSDSAEAVAIYRAEPYVVAADVYGVPPHTGRGGWTWYTGSAGWMYRLITESLLGLRVEEGKLRLAPSLPREWAGFDLRYRHLGTTYAIRVVQRDDADGSIENPALTVDGVPQEGPSLTLVDDGREHKVEVRLRPPLLEV
jgi:cellobiose phosphorylase